MRVPTTVLIIAVRSPIERFCDLGWGVFLYALVVVGWVYVELKVETNDDIELAAHILLLQDIHDGFKSVILPEDILAKATC